MNYTIIRSNTYIPPVVNGINPLGNPRAHAVLDFDGNQTPDILLNANFFTSYPELPFIVLLNQGNGTFSYTTLNTGGATLGDLNAGLVADFNGDGIKDMLAVDQGLEVPPFGGHSNHLFLSGQGALTYRPDLLPPDTNFHHSGVLADVNRDGAMDVAIAQFPLPSASTKENVYFLINDGTGRFTRSTAGLPTELLSYQGNNGAVAMSDVNNDGRADLITSNYQALSGEQQFTTVYSQSGDGQFTETARLDWTGLSQAFSAAQPGVRYGTSSMAVDDFDGDGRRDIVQFIEGSTYIGSGNDGTSYLIAWHNNGDGTFADVTAQWFGGYAAPKGVLGGGVERIDYNADGIPDLRLLTYSSPGPNAVFVNDGAGHFSHPTDAPGGAFFADLIDVNSDGAMDWLTFEMGGTWTPGQGFVGLTATPITYLADAPNRVNGDALANTLQGSAGQDVMAGHSGNDIMTAMGGNDTVFGGDGADALYGNQGADVLHGETGDDTLFGGQGNDVLYGAAGADVLYGNMAVDLLYGGVEADTLFGGQGDDDLRGEAGNDFLAGNLGHDNLWGGDGADTFVFGLGGGFDVVMDFQPGVDHLSFSGRTTEACIAALRDLNGSAYFDFGDMAVRLQGIAASTVNQSFFV